jgi:hypothetical protein
VSAVLGIDHKSEDFTTAAVLQQFLLGSVQPTDDVRGWDLGQ